MIAVPQLADTHAIQYAAISANGALAATSSRSYTVVWDVEAGRQVRHERGLWKIALENEGRALLLGWKDLKLCVRPRWECTTLAVPAPNPKNGWLFDHMGFSPSGRHAWAYREDDSSVIIDVGTASVRRIRGHIVAITDQSDGGMTVFFVEPGGGDYLLFASRSSPGSPTIRDQLAGGGGIATPDGPIPVLVDASAISPDGKALVIVTSFGTTLFDTTQHETPVKLGESTPRDIAFDGDNVLLATQASGEITNEIEIYDRRGHRVGAPAGKFLAMNGRATLADDYTVTTPTKTTKLEVSGGSPDYTFDTTPDGRNLLLDVRGRVWLWDLTDPRGALQANLGRPATADPETLAQFADGAAVIAAGPDLRRWDPEEDRVEIAPGSATSRGNVIAISSDSSLVFRADGNGSQIGTIWTLPALRTKETLVIPNAPADGVHEVVTTAAFSKSGRRLITGSTSGAARVWDVATGRQIARLDHPFAVVQVLAETDDRVITTDESGGGQYPHESEPSPRVWSIPTRGLPRLERWMGRHLNATSRDGSRMVVDDWVLDGGGHRLWQLPAIPSSVVAFADDDQRVAVADSANPMDPDLYSTPFGPDHAPVAVHVFANAQEIDTIPMEDLDLISLKFAGPYLLLGIDADRILHIWRTCNHERGCHRDAPAEICRVLVTTQGWLAVDALGRYDTSDFDALSKLAWTLSDKPFAPMPADMFIRDFYVPGLVSKLVTTALPTRTLVPPPPLPPDMATIDRSVPTVKIESVIPATSPACTGDTCPPPRVRVELDVSAEAGGTREAFDVRLLRDGNLTAELPVGEATHGNALAQWQAATRVELDANGHRKLEVEVPLAATHSTTELSAYAFNASRLKGPTSRLTYQLPAPAKHVRPRAFVVVVGVASSGPDLAPLTWAPVDALEMMRLLTSALSGTYRVVPIVMVSDTPATRGTHGPCARKRVIRPTLAGIHAVLAALGGAPPAGDVPTQEIELPCLAEASTTLPEALTPDDVLFVYVSAHGVSDQGEFSIVGEGGERIAASQLAVWMRAVQSDHVTVILDTCDSEKAIAGAEFRPGPLGDFTFGQLAFDKSMRILAASGANQDAVDSARVGGSLLVDALRQELARERTITIGELLRGATHAVPALFRQLRIAGQVQRPVVFDYGRNVDDVELEGNP